MVAGQKMVVGFHFNHGVHEAMATAEMAVTITIAFTITAAAVVIVVATVVTTAAAAAAAASAASSK